MSNKVGFKQFNQKDMSLVRALFMREWNPIGVGEIEDAQDEYDAYASKAYVMLMNEQASPKQIADYLYDIEAEYIGLGPSTQAQQRAYHVAQQLSSMRAQFESE